MLMPKARTVQVGDIWKGWLCSQSEQDSVPVFKKVIKVENNYITMSDLDGSNSQNYVDIANLDNWRLLKRNNKTICNKCK
jgi:hypothetical protein